MQSYIFLLQKSFGEIKRKSSPYRLLILVVRSTLRKRRKMRLRAVVRNTSCCVCLLCPLRSMSANALRLRLSSLVVTKVSVTYTHKKMSTANSVLVFIMCRNETCSEQSERNSERGEFTHRSERHSDGAVRTMRRIVVRNDCAQVQVSVTRTAK